MRVSKIEGSVDVDGNHQEWKMMVVRKGLYMPKFGFECQIKTTQNQRLYSN